MNGNSYEEVKIILTHKDIRGQTTIFGFRDFLFTDFSQYASEIVKPYDDTGKRSPVCVYWTSDELGDYDIGNSSPKITLTNHIADFYMDYDVCQFLNPDTPASQWYKPVNIFLYEFMCYQDALKFIADKLKESSEYY